MTEMNATPTLRDLDIFILAASTQNLSATAEKLGMTPAGISKSIGRLERLYGIKMFERAGRGLALTSAGRLVYKRSLSIDGLIKLLLTEATDLNAANAGLVRLGASPAMVTTIVAPAVARLVSGSPTAQIELHSQASERLIEDLQAGTLDIAIAVMPTKVSPDLRFDKLGATRNFIVARPGHPLLRRSFKLEDLCQQRWMGTPLHAQWITNFFANAGLPAPPLSIRTDVSPTVFASILTSSDLLAVMDLSLLEDKVAASLAMLPAPAPTRVAQFGLFWRKQAFFSPAMKRCRTELMRAYRNKRDF